MQSTPNPVATTKSSVSSLKTARKESVKKWGPLVARQFTLIPAILFDEQKKLGLDPVDFNLLLQLLSFWWRAADLPWPSKQTLADRIGVDTSTVRRHMTRMQKMGLVERRTRIDKTRGQQSNSYNLKPLVQKLQKLAAEAKRKADAKSNRSTNSSPF
jgi:predicted transcriptional regulator